MKKLLISFALMLTLCRSHADEGMWLPMLLGKQVYNDMVKRGLKLTKEQLYSINKSSLKDAIIIFGRGCTGEIVSNQGLIFTNHHCGYSQIQAHSSLENDYLKNGFWAQTMAQELPNPGLTATRIVRIEDVTAAVLAGASSKADQATIAANIKKLV